MTLFDISIKYYKGIEVLENLKCGDINTYVGKNDSGKSIILKALNCFFNNEFSFSDTYKGIPAGEVTQIKLRFTPTEPINSLALDSDGKISLIKKMSFSTAGRLNKDLFYEHNDISDDRFENVWGVKEENLNNYLEELGIQPTRSGRGVTNLSKIEQIDQNTQTIGRRLKIHPAEDFIKNIVKQYGSVELPEYYFFNAEQDLNVSSAEFQNQFKPIANQSLENNANLTTQIETNVESDLENEFKIISTLMKKNVPELDKIKPNITCNWKNLVKFDLSLKFTNENYDIPIANKGTGFKRLLMVAYFEYLAQRQANRYRIYGLEEPETFLHPSLQYDLLESIKILSENNQFFLTTHSPVFAGATKDTNIVIVKKNNGISTYHNSENADRALDEVINELGIRPNFNLLNDDYRKVVFVEGKGDVLFWEIALTKLNGAIPTEILFIPCGGDQLEFFVNAKLCRKINRHFLFIADSDKGAINYNSKLASKANIKLTVENMGGEFELLMKREIENYYHRDAIQRILGTSFTLPNDFQINPYEDIKEVIKEKILATYTGNFKAKNNLEIFREMTVAEWDASSVPVNGSNDLRKIIQKILV